MPTSALAESIVPFDAPGFQAGTIQVTGGECVGGGTRVNDALAFDPVRAR